MKNLGQIMANTFISIDPETKVQKTVTIPDGCIIVEMKAKEMSDFIMKTFAGFLFADEKARLQVFPKEVKTFDGIWQYVYPIKRGVAAIMVNEEKWGKLLKDQKAKEEKERIEQLCSNDIAAMRIKYDEARIFYLASKGVLTTIAMDYLFPEFKKDKNQDEDILCEVVLQEIVEQIKIDLSAVRKELTKSRKQYHFYVLEFPISEEQRIAFLDHATHVLCEIVDRKPIRKKISNYLEAFNDAQIDCYKLLKKIYRENGDDDNLFKTLERIIFNLDIKCNRDNASYKVKYFIEKSIGELNYYIERLKQNWEQRWDSEQITELKRKIKERHPKVNALYYWCVEPSLPSHMNPESININYTSSFEEAKRAEESGNKTGNYSYALDLYEAIAYRDKSNKDAYARLMIIYRKYKMYDDEIRVIKLALANCTDNMKLVAEWKERLEKAEELKYKAYIKSLQEFE